MQSPIEHRPALSRVPAIVLACLAVGGCSVGYYWQAVRGHMELMSEREPVPQVLDDPQTDDYTRAQLDLAQQAVDFAHADLALPDNGSYRQYVDTGRPYVVWNVVATPPWSLQPRTWCFPIAGCVSYRGYFSEVDARDFAALRAARGDDVFVGGAIAYSTLGRFQDPLTNVMLGAPDYRLAGLIFHELAHQRLYVAGDSAFNESFASAVEQAGIRRWLHARRDAAGLCRYERWLVRRAAVRDLLARGRAELEVLYTQNADPATLADGKAAAMNAIHAAYRQLRQGWRGPPYFDAWFSGELNNARLAALATYDQYVPAFVALLSRRDGDFAAFYAAAETLGNLPAAEREAALAELAGAAVSGPPTKCLSAAVADPGSPPG